MERHAEALEYARMAVELRPFITDTGLYRPYAHCHLAMSLAGLGRNDEALEHLGIAQELAARTGSDRMAALCLITSGFIEKAEGNLVSAMQSFEDALSIGIPQDYTRTIVELARIEVELFTPTESNHADGTSGPWMERLEQEVTTGYKPGFVGLALLLKAQLRRKQGSHEEENELLSRVREMAEDPRLQFLNALLVRFIKVSP
jgi:tetratricopeptide (TPR) repeat protein